MTTPAVFKTLMLIASCLLLPALALACSGDDDKQSAAGHRVATYNEHCPRCGIQWSVKVDQNANGPDSVEVMIENSGERGTLDLIFDALDAVALSADQATRWRNTYPGARAERNAILALRANGATRLSLLPVPGTNLPFELRPGSSWSGRYATEIPPGTTGVIFAFGPVEHERTPPDLRAIDYWITWDHNRPYIGLDGEVWVTPVASPPGSR